MPSVSDWVPLDKHRTTVNEDMDGLAYSYTVTEIVEVEVRPRESVTVTEYDWFPVEVTIAVSPVVAVEDWEIPCPENVMFVTLAPEPADAVTDSVRCEYPCTATAQLSAVALDECGVAVNAEMVGFIDAATDTVNDLDVEPTNSPAL